MNNANSAVPGDIERKKASNKPRCRKEFVVYRGEGFSKTDSDTQKYTKSGLNSFSNFLSTSENRKTSFFASIILNQWTTSMPISDEFDTSG